MSKKSVRIMEKNAVKLNMNDMARLASSNDIENFYLVSDRLMGFFDNESALIFDGFIIIAFRHGSAEMKVNGRRYRVSEGSVLFLAPNLMVEVTERSDDIVYKAVAVSLDMIMDFPTPVDTEIIDRSRKNPSIHVGSSDMEHLIDCFRSIETCYSRAENIYRREILKAYLYALVLEIGNLCRSVEGGSAEVPRLRQESLSDEFFMLLSQHYKKERTVGFYAEQMHLTPKYLSEAIKRITGRSILEWIHEVIILEIKIRLKTTDKTVLEISEALDFSTPSAFVQFFRLHVGTTPLQYRKNGNW